MDALLNRVPEVAARPRRQASQASSVPVRHPKKRQVEGVADGAAELCLLVVEEEPERVADDRAADQFAAEHPDPHAALGPWGQPDR